MQEQWIRIAGTNDNYDVSNRGNIRVSFDAEETHTHIARSRWGELTTFTRKYKLARGSILATCVSKRSPYKRVTFSREVNMCRTQLVHRLVAAGFLGLDLAQADAQVNHKNGVKTDNVLENLELVTAQGNTDHAIRTGLFDPRGSQRIPWSTITEGRALVAAGMRQTDAARKLGIDSKVLHLAIRGKTYKQPPLIAA